MASVARETDELASVDCIANFHLNAVFLEVDVMAQCAIRMLDQDVIGVPLELFVGAANVGIILDSHDQAFACGVDRTAFGHFEIDGIAIATMMTVFSMETLADRERHPRGIRELVHVAVVVLNGEITPGGVIGVGPAGILSWFRGVKRKDFLLLAGRDGSCKRCGSARGQILQFQIDSDGYVGKLEVFHEELGYSFGFGGGDLN